MCIYNPDRPPLFERRFGVDGGATAARVVVASSTSRRPGAGAPRAWENALPIARARESTTRARTRGRMRRGVRSRRDARRGERLARRAWITKRGGDDQFQSSSGSSSAKASTRASATIGDAAAAGATAANTSSLSGFLKNCRNVAM